MRLKLDLIAPGDPAPRLSKEAMTVFGSQAAIRSLLTLKPTFNENYLLFSRRFEGSIKPKPDGQVFRVMQWNMLAQGLLL
jgi:hypothetical protein